MSARTGFTDGRFSKKPSDFLVTCLVFGMLILFFPSKAFAYQTIYDIRWTYPNLPVKVTLENVTSTATLTKPEWQREIIAAMQIWNSGGTELQFKEATSDIARVNIRMVSSSEIPGLVAATCFKNTPSGICTRPSGPGGSFLYAEIKINRDYNWIVRESGDMGILANEPDPRTIVAHELGHVLGLDESSTNLAELNLFERDALMYTYGTKVHRYLSDSDILGLRHLYGPLTDFSSYYAPVDATFISDVSIPDDTILSPNQLFVKTWRLRNTGAATWDFSYKLGFTNGDLMEASSSIGIPRSVLPGQEKDFSVTMKAPSATGTYQSYWRMKDILGREFGDPVWVKIRVGSTAIQSPPPPVNGNSIEIISVSSHTVQPGEQFNPSIKFKVASGKFDIAKGDHLHATPEDNGNTFGAYPVQPVRTVVNSGQTYTFDSNNDSSFRMTAPTQPGIYRSVWQMRVGGVYIGPKVVIQITVQQAPPPPDTWSVDYWMNPALAGFVNWHNTDSNRFLFYDWGSGGPGGGIPSDSWSARFIRNVYFPGGNYRFHCQHDDGCRIYIDGQERVSGWGGSGEHNWEGAVSPGSHEIRVEYFENTGGARMEAWWQGPGFLPLDQACDLSQWCSEYWGNPGLTGDPAIRVNEGNGTLDRSWSSGGPGYGMPSDNFAARWRQNVPFECGHYRFNIHSDDGVRVWVGGQSVLDAWGARGADFQREIDLPSGTSLVQVEYLEVGGDASVRVTWDKLSACPPPCPDVFEPDNSLAQAHPFAVGNTEVHAFCVANDDDWVSFSATAGAMYRIAILDGNFPWWAEPSLYRSDGTLLLNYLTGSAWKAPTTGTYYLKIRHALGNGDLSYTYKLSIMTVTTPCSDTYEPDNSSAQLHAFTVGYTEAHAFCVQYDDDWVSFSAKAGAAYRIETLELAPWLSTKLYLYASDKVTQIAEDQGPPQLTGSYPSVLTFTPTTAGTYYVKVREFGNAGDPTHTYKLRITQANLLLNPSFEADTNNDTRPDSWTSQSQVTRSNSVVHSGTYSMRHFATNNSNYTLAQAITGLTAGMRYDFSSWVNIPATSDAFTFKLQLAWRNASNATLATTVVKSYSVATNGWDNVISTFVAPAGTTNAQVQMAVSSLNAAIYIDDIALSSKGNILPAAWTPDQWQNVSSFSVDKPPAHSGTRAASISSSTENDARWTQHVTVKVNTNYVLSGWIKTNGVREDVVGASLGLVDDWPRTPDIRGTQDWTYIDVTINSGSRTDLYLGARLGHWSNLTTGTAWFDDLSLREQTSNGLGSNLLQNASFEQ